MLKTKSQEFEGNVFKVEYFDVVESFRKYRMENLDVLYGLNLNDLNDFKDYAQEVVSTGEQLIRLSSAYKHEDRFKHLRSLCKEGFTPLMFPFFSDIEGELRADKKIVILVFEGDTLLGGLTNRDLYF